MGDVAVESPEATALPHRSPVEARGDELGRYIFRGLAIGSLVLMVFLSPRYAITTDEPVQSVYGRLSYTYFRSGFVDRSAMHFGNLYLYGGLFDLICAVAEPI